MASGKGFTGFESGSNGDNTLYNTLNGSIARSGNRYLAMPMVGTPSTVTTGAMTVSTTTGGGFIARMYVRRASVGGSGSFPTLIDLGVSSVVIDTAGQILASNSRGNNVVGTIPDDGAWHELVVIYDQHTVTMPAALIGSILGYSVSGSVYNFVGSGSQMSGCIAASIDGAPFVGYGRDDGAASRSVTNLSIGNGGGSGTGHLLIDDLQWAWNDTSIPTLPANTHVYPVGINAINSKTGFTGSLSDVQAFPPTVAGTTPPYYATALDSTSPSATVTFGHPSHISLVLGDVEAVKVVVFARRDAAGTATFDAKLGAGTIASIAAGSIPQTNSSAELPPVGYDYTGWTVSAFDALTFGITQTNTGHLEIGSMMLEVLAGEYEPIDPVIDTISPDSGPTSGGTTVTMTGIFNPTSFALFDQYGSKFVSVTETTLVVVTPPHPAGAVDVVVVTPVAGEPPKSATVPNGFTFIAPPPPGTITLDAARRDPEIQVSNQLGNGQNSFGFSVNGEDADDFQPGSTVDMQLGTGDTISRGVLLQTTRTVEDSRFNERVDCNGNDNVWVLNAKLVKGTWDHVSASTIATTVINKFAPDFSSAGVQLSLPAISLTISLDANVGQVLDRICALLPDGHWYLDTSDVIHLFNGVESGVPAPDDLNDSNEDLRLAEFPIQIKTDISQIRNRVYVRGSGSSSSTGYQAPVGVPPGDPGGEAPWVSEGGGWGSLLETGGDIDTDRNTGGVGWYWWASYIFVWTTTNGDSDGGWTARWPAPTPLHASSYTTGSNQIGLTVDYASLDSRITGLKIYRELQRDGPHGLNAATYGNTNLYSPNQDGGHGPFFLIGTFSLVDILINYASHAFRYLDTASEDTLVGGEMKKFSELVGQDHSANVFTTDEDTDSQAALAALLGYGDGAREFLVTDPSISTTSQAHARGQAELALWADPIVEITYATTDPKTKVGATVHVDLTNPNITGDFKIQSIRLAHIHENDDTLPVIVATASSVRFTLNDLFAHVMLDSDAGSGRSPSAPSAPDAPPSGAAATALQLSPGKNINGVLFNGSADVVVSAAMDHIGEVPTGSVNGSNTVFTTAASYVGSTISVYVNGIRQKKTTDYTESSATTITFTTAPSTGDVILVDYQHAT